MIPQISFRLLMAFFITAAFINITNYVFYSLFEKTMRAVFEVNGSSKLPAKVPFNIHEYRPRTSTALDGLLTVVDNITQSVDSTQAADATYSYAESSTESLVSCPAIPPGLGPVELGDGIVNAAAGTNKYALLHPGGVYQTLECKTRQSVALIVLNRGIKKHLNTFVYFIHPFLMRQQLDYQIFVVESEKNAALLNRGQLLNIAFTEAQKVRSGGWSCLVLHEAHVLPTDYRNLYRCNGNPRQLAASIEITNKSAYIPNFGGAVSLFSQQFEDVNGFSNLFLLGTDYEFESLHKRLALANYTIERSEQSVGRYKSMRAVPKNKNESSQSEAMPLLNAIDGLSTLWTISYKVNVELLNLYTLINVAADKTKDPQWSRSMLNTILQRFMQKSIKHKRLQINL